MTEALAIYGPGAARILSVTDAEVAEAIHAYYNDIHNLAEGAGAAGLVALKQGRDPMEHSGVIVCGGKIHTDWFLTVMQGGVPRV